MPYFSKIFNDYTQDKGCSNGLFVKAITTEILQRSKFIKNKSIKIPTKRELGITSFAKNGFKELDKLSCKL